jgi:D-ribose pyranase
MKKHGILNSDIARVLASMGHTDSIVIADCGLPIPADVERIDLALQLGQPSFLDTLAAVMADMQVERAVLASEALEHNPAVSHKAGELKQAGVLVDYVSHEDFKALCRRAKAVIRTGEATPYANIVLYSGVVF